MSCIVMLMVSDGLRQPSGSLAEAPYRHLIYCKIPDDWIEGAIPDSDELWIKGPALNPESLDKVLNSLYGAGWRGGNSDGSQYVVLGMGSRVLNPRRESEHPWDQDDFSDETLRILHYAAGADGQLNRILPSML